MSLVFDGARYYLRSQEFLCTGCIDCIQYPVADECLICPPG